MKNGKARQFDAVVVQYSLSPGSFEWPHLSAVVELWGHLGVNEIQTHDFFPVSVEAGLDPSLSKQADQGLARGLLGGCEAFAALLGRSVATLSRLLNTF